ncbi:hypothetical protein NQ318_013658 [Aromia moschata]|uniref:RNA helicase n=1 Tax=Aromia moschata TaxID=1265417 RepID=A0AAV8XZT6_9CUCU|nr:hypothetical protein NQ318_013658 [Aromia moschata]
MVFGTGIPWKNESSSLKHEDIIPYRKILDTEATSRHPEFYDNRYDVLIFQEQTCSKYLFGKCYHLLKGHSLNSNRTKDVITEGNVTFESLLLNGDVLKGLEQSGFRKPSPIQVKAIPIGRCGFDIIVRSKSGTGKTLVYSLIALENVDTSRNETQVLIMAPTREVVVQIQEVLTSIGKYINGLQVKSFIGGLPIQVDKENCNSCHIAVGTPGRIKHLISDGCLKTNSIRLFALDEVDKLMESSFVNDVNDIYNSLPGRIQIVTTSATYTDELEGFLQKYMLSPIQIVVEDTTPLLWGLKQFAVVLKPHTNVVQQMKIKTEEILEILSRISFTQCIIFTNYQTRAESVSNMLNQKGWNSSYISAAKSQSERLAALASLKRFNCRILLSTDLTARGIDVANIDLVINYDVPVDAVTYLHRMGRAGRFGSLGACINLVSEGPDGGPTFSIPMLPDFNGNVLDLINEKVHCESHLCATTESSANIPDIKKEVLSVKEVGHVPKQDEQQRGSEEDSSGVDKTAEDEIMDFLNGTKKEAACNERTVELGGGQRSSKTNRLGEAVELNSVCDSARFLQSYERHFSAT